MLHERVYLMFGTFGPCRHFPSYHGLFSMRRSLPCSKRFCAELRHTCSVFDLNHLPSVFDFGSYKERLTCFHVGNNKLANIHVGVGNFMSQEFDICLRSFCADSSSPQISAILVGHFTVENNSLRNYPQNFCKNCAMKYTNPSSRNSLSQKPPNLISKLCVVSITA